jgi:hypothetical protein
MGTTADLTREGFTQAGNLSVQTSSSGSTWVSLSSQACVKLTISNQTGTSLEVRQDGAGVGFVMPTGLVFTFEGISNANQLSLRRVDVSNTQVTASTRWVL